MRFIKVIDWNGTDFLINVAFISHIQKAEQGTDIFVNTGSTYKWIACKYPFEEVQAVIKIIEENEPTYNNMPGNDLPK